MPRVCQITGKKTQVGNKVSHANNKTLRRFYPNIHIQKFYLASEKRWITLKLSARGLRTINKIGLEAALLKAAEKGHLERV
ncbi:MAG: 50S ribosomal protein L28 [Cytophagaceae bacterium]|jgi:large subunit ribosomal protein L28|nr:50S ribosomal protein L28 [Cytophagaceae bacterium]